MIQRMAASPMLAPGDVMTQGEFLAAWEQASEIKRAELIEGVVYMPSAISLAHMKSQGLVSVWLGHYSAGTPGCEFGDNGTWLMLEDAPQPDCCLFLDPACGGQATVQDGFAAGAPELAAEVSLSSRAYDLHQKRRLYERAGVREYVIVLLHEQEVRWLRHDGQSFQRRPPDADGLYRSAVFPGLWLDPQALLALDGARVLAVVQQGLATPEHAAFVAELAARKRAAADRAPQSEHRP